MIQGERGEDDWIDTQYSIFDDDVYSIPKILEYEDDGTLTPSEAGFMMGWLEEE